MHRLTGRLHPACHGPPASIPGQGATRAVQG